MYVAIYDVSAHDAAINEVRNGVSHIRFMATHDALTGLPNRTQLNERLEALVFASAQANTELTVYFLIWIS
jgi:GGDEF domain-containing protein